MAVGDSQGQARLLKPGYSLVDAYSSLPPLHLDFGAADFRYRLKVASRRSELIARVIKAGPGLRVLDCTGGLGRDAFLLAWLGCEVTLCERSRVIFTLLADALHRARADESLADAADRIQLHCLDAADLLQGKIKCGNNPWIFPNDRQSHNAGHKDSGEAEQGLPKHNANSMHGGEPEQQSDNHENSDQLASLFDVIYLDPMFPARVKSASVKGDMQSLQAFLGHEQQDTSETRRLLQLALATGVSKTVLKRPAKSSWHAPLKPNHVFNSRVSRFEVYLPGMLRAYPASC